MSLQFLKEAISEISQKNEEYCANKVSDIQKKIQPFLDDVDQNPKQDESVFVFIYYRKGNDMETHSSKASISRFCNDIDITLAHSWFEQLKIINTPGIDGF